ncbi:TM2 domain-containing protein [Lacinutrix venerupis]|uniref:TM2 domain-containing protein n=1 Tax=Lacinutrix venerupis TaxID=1486034 RepID=UPI0009FA96D9|nr:TM2 domain-containing protein [Lacinutrix venerupis]RLJ65567.1 TM2 domain-containing protein [Lacinutrix venerupis]
MSDEKNLKSDLDDMLGDAKEGAKKASDKANEFAEDAKETINEFSNNAKEAFGGDTENKKMIAGILAIVIGSLGVHKFILGYNKEGIIQIIATIVTCGIAGIIPFIEGIIYLTKTDEEFYNTYQVGKKGWF